MSKNKRLVALMLRCEKPSKFINVSLSRRGQLVIRCSNTSCPIVMCCKSRLFKFLKPWNVGGGLTKQLNSSRCVKFWHENKQECSLYLWPFHISRTNSLIGLLDRWRIHRSISVTPTRSRWESLNLYTGPVWSKRTWSIMLTSLLLMTAWSWEVSEIQWLSNTRFGSVAHLYRHFVDRTLVLTASLIDNWDKIWSIICPGKLLSLSSSISVWQGLLGGSLFCSKIHPSDD